MLPLLKGDRQAFGASKSPFDPDAISKLKTGFGGRLIVPGDTEYETVRGALSMNPETDKYPALVAQCKNEEDVSRCVDFAHEQELEVAVRSRTVQILDFSESRMGYRRGFPLIWRAVLQ